MRILGSRASAFSNDEIRWMLNNGLDVGGNPLTEGQIEELKKTLKRREETD